MGLREAMKRAASRLGDLFEAWFYLGVPDHPSHGGIAGERDGGEQSDDEDSSENGTDEKRSEHTDGEERSGDYSAESR